MGIFLAELEKLEVTTRVKKWKRSRLKGRQQKVMLKKNGGKLPLQFFKEKLDTYLNSFINNMFKRIPVKSGDNTKLGKIVNTEEKQEIKRE